MDTADALRSFNTAADQLIDLFQKQHDPDWMVYDAWSARDVLAHLTFWHESFARNVSDLVAQRKPRPLKGRFADLNQQGVESMRGLPLDAVIKRFQAAHIAIQENILNPSLTLIPYKVGSRDYSPQEHLNIVQMHIEQHTRDIQKAFSKGRIHA